MWYPAAAASGLGSSDPNGGWPSAGPMGNDASGVPWPVTYYPMENDKQGCPVAPNGVHPSQMEEEDIEEDNSIDLLLTQLLNISKKSPTGTNDGSLESLGVKNESAAAPATVPTHLGAAPAMSYQDVMKGDCSDLWADVSTYHDSSAAGEHCSELTPEEEAAICALVPKLVKVSMSKSVRGVYLDRRRGLWRANWREGGKVKTKGFRIAQWGEHEARRKAVEVRKLMETRGCFLKLKAVAMGDPQRILSDPDLYNSPIFQAAPSKDMVMSPDLYYPPWSNDQFQRNKRRRRSQQRWDEIEDSSKAAEGPPHLFTPS